MATLILGTSGLWVGYSQNGVTDIPLTVTYSAGMLLAMPWVVQRDTRSLPWAAAMFGLAVMAKGLVPLALAAPLLLGRHVRDWLRWRVVLPFFAVALPWYALCYARNGWTFIQEFIVSAAFLPRDFGRADASAALVVLPANSGGGTAAVVAAVRASWRGARDGTTGGDLFLGMWALTVLVLFSMAINKLPGLHSADDAGGGVLMALGLDEAADARAWLAGVCAAAGGFPDRRAGAAGGGADGARRHAPPPRFQAAWLAVAPVAGRGVVAGGARPASWRRWPSSRRARPSESPI